MQIEHKLSHKKKSDISSTAILIISATMEGSNCLIIDHMSLCHTWLKVDMDVE